MLAVDVFVRRVRKYLGAYLVHLGGRVDAVVFSAGGGRGRGVYSQQVADGGGVWECALWHGEDGDAREWEKK